MMLVCDGCQAASNLEADYAPQDALLIDTPHHWEGVGGVFKESGLIRQLHRFQEHMCKNDKLIVFTVRRWKVMFSGYICVYLQ